MMTDESLQETIDLVESGGNFGRRHDDAEIASLSTWATSHEKVCSERWADARFRLRRIEGGIVAGVVAVIAAMWWLLQQMIDKVGDQIAAAIIGGH